MSEADPVNAEATQNAMILGEMRGQLREVVHAMNNLSGKFDGLTREVVALGALATLVGKLEAQADAIDVRLKAVEAKQSQQSGAAGMVKTILNSPVLGWIFLGAVTLWAALNGKVNL